MMIMISGLVLNEYFIMDVETQLSLGFQWEVILVKALLLFCRRKNTHEMFCENAIYVFKLVLILKELIKKLHVVSGSFSCLQKALRKLEMNYGLLDTY